MEPDTKSPLEHPIDLPQEFKAWLIKYLEANPPSLPLAGMLGYIAGPTMKAGSTVLTGTGATSVFNIDLPQGFGKSLDGAVAINGDYTISTLTVLGIEPVSTSRFVVVLSGAPALGAHVRINWIAFGV